MEKPVIDRIMEAAKQEFAKKGFEGARVDEIARLARVNKATLYYQVGDKQKLYSAVIVSCFTPIHDQMEKIGATAKNASDQLRAIITIVATQIYNNRAMNAILMRELATGGVNFPDEALAVIGPLKRAMHNVIETGIKNGEFTACDPNLIHFVIVGGINFYVASAPVQQKLKESGEVEGDYSLLESGEVLGEKIANVILRGITNEG